MIFELIWEAAALFTPLGGLLFVVLFWAQVKTAQGGALWMILFRWPSTICHEFQHILVGWVTRAGVTGISIWPRRVEGGWVLGSVTCSNLGVFSAFPVAMAPLLNLIPAYYLLSQQATGGILYTVAGFVFLSASVPSWMDFCVMSRFPVSVSFWVAVLGGIYAGVCSAFELVTSCHQLVGV